MGLDRVQELIAHYGVWFYVITFIWTFIEGETFVIYAGVLAAQGLIDLPLLMACAWLGSFCGDQTYFSVGRLFGPRILKRFPRFQAKADLVERWLKKHDAAFILGFRWLYGIRNFASLGLGMTSIPRVRFLWLNFIAAGVWAGGFIAIGYGAGIALRPMIERLAHHFTLVMLGIFVVMMGAVYLAHRVQSYLQARRREPVVNPAE
jgi:membrane protein DedA with SNARE-associated domain